MLFDHISCAFLVNIKNIADPAFLPFIFLSARAALTFQNHREKPSELESKKQPDSSLFCRAKNTSAPFLFDFSTII